MTAKLFFYSMAGYVFRLHTNGDSKKGIRIVLLAELLNLLFFKRSSLSFHAGTDQTYFPDRGGRFLNLVWRTVFGLAGSVICDCEEVREMILRYRKDRRAVHAVSPFSSRRIRHEKVSLDREKEIFISTHSPLLFTYIAYRPEYSIDILLKSLDRIKNEYDRIGLLVVDDRSHPDPLIWERMKDLAVGEQGGRIMFTGSVGRDEFLTMLGRSDLFVRTPVTDGVCSSVLESLYLGVPVLAVENNNRPPQVVTYLENSLEQLSSSLKETLDGLDDIRDKLAEIQLPEKDSVEELVDIVLGLH
jgi:glycosyltransferase involved in cell wall biosynthesis